MNRQRLLERFLRYVQVDTTAHDATEQYPSSPGQLRFGQIVADELRAMGASEVLHDAHGVVWATLPATLDRPVPVRGVQCTFRYIPGNQRRGSPPHRA